MIAPLGVEGVRMSVMNSMEGPDLDEVGGEPGLEVSPVHLFEHVDIQRLISHQPLQSSVLLF